MEPTQEHQAQLKQAAEDIHFGQYWQILKRHWLPASGVFTLAVVLAAAASTLEKPSYEAEGKLLFKKRDATISLLTQGEQGGGTKVGELESLNVLNTPVDTEAEVLRTTPLVTKAIRKLDLRDAQGRLVQADTILKGLVTKGIKGTDVLLVSYKGSEPQKVAAIVNELMVAYIENNVLINRTEATAAREFITGQLPKTEAILAEAEAELRDFREQNKVVALKDEATEAVKAIAQLDDQIAKTQANLADTASRSTALGEKIGINQQEAVALNSLSQSPGVKQALEEYQKAESQLAAQRGRFQDDSPVVASLKSKEESLRSLLRQRIGKVLGTQQPISDAVLQSSQVGINLNKDLQLGELKQRLIADLVNSEVSRRGLVSQLETLSQTRLVYQQRTAAMPRLEQVQDQLQRRVLTAKSNYDVLVKRLQEVRIAENQNVGNARIVSPAVAPKQPIASKKKLVLAGGVIVGALLYVITAFLLDLRSPSIRTAKEVRQLFPYTLLGLIPSLRKGTTLSRKHIDSVPELPVRDNPHSLAAESYRMLQANLKFLSPDQPLKSMVVTSSVSKEGKSTVSANLAIAMAELGQRVLLIDADLRYPMQHHIWGLTNMVGLSDLVVGQTESKQAIVEVMANLDVLPSGAVPPNPLALIDSKRMRSLVEEFTQTYDFVIFDAPPLVLVADAPTLSKMTDGTLLVARPGVVDAASAGAAREFLVRSKQPVLGLVVNGVVAEHEPDSYFHHAKVYYKDAAARSLPANV